MAKINNKYEITKRPKIIATFVLVFSLYPNLNISHIIAQYTISGKYTSSTAHILALTRKPRITSIVKIK